MVDLAFILSPVRWRVMLRCQSPAALTELVRQSHRLPAQHQTWVQDELSYRHNKNYLTPSMTA